MTKRTSTMFFHYVLTAVIEDRDTESRPFLGFKGLNTAIGRVTRVKLRRNKVDKTVTTNTSGRR